MAGSDLSKRLAILRRQKQGDDRESGPAASPPAAGTSAEKNSLPPEGWKQTGEYTCRRDLWVPFKYPGTFQTAPFLGFDLSAGECLFFDTETTGLSGGAGTIAFLIGIGRFENGKLRVSQFFVRDFPGEGEMLRQFAREIGDPVFVSYNGKAFDSQLLHSRGVLQGLKLIFDRQADLLYPARRLWKSLLPSCSLGSIESEVLGVHRENDVPGREVPEYYFSFLKTGDFSTLQGVFDHNDQDIRSLAELLLFFHRICGDPFKQEFIDRFSLGRMLDAAGDSRGLDLVRRSFEAGNAAAGVYLAIQYKRRKAWGPALKIWELLWEGNRTQAGLIEIAKYFEHVEKDYHAALQAVEKLMAHREGSGPAGHLHTGSGRFDAELEHRRNRLRRKIGGLK